MNKKTFVLIGALLSTVALAEECPKISEVDRNIWRTATFEGDVSFDINKSGYKFTEVKLQNNSKNGSYAVDCFYKDLKKVSQPNYVKFTRRGEGSVSYTYEQYALPGEEPKDANNVIKTYPCIANRTACGFTIK